MSEEFIREFSDLLEIHNSEEAVQLFLAQSDEVITSAMSDIVRITTGYFTKSNKQSQPTLFENCRIILNIITDTCNPKETVLEFLQYIEYQDDDVKFCVILKLLSTCILKMEDKINAIDWCTSALKLYIEDLPIPDNNDGEDAAISRIINVYIEIISFLKLLVADITKSDLEHRKDSLFRDNLLSFLISLYGKPFCFLNYDISKKNMEKIYGQLHRKGSTHNELSEDMMVLVFCLANDVLYHLDIVSKRCRNIIRDEAQDKHINIESYISSMLFELSENISNLAYANFYFHVITDETYWKNLPQVYNSYYILEMCMYLGQILLCQESNIMISKGLILMENVMKRISPCTVPSDVFEIKIYLDIFQSITKVMLYCDDLVERKKAAQIFKQYIEIFDMETRYFVILYLYDISEHSGLLGLIITMFKSSLVECLNSTPPNHHFLGKNMKLMLKKICKLPHGSSSDLVEIMEEVITTLNLLRFLFIRDRNNDTGVWDMKDMFEDEYLKPLRKGIDLCRAHWKVKIKDMEQQKEDYTNVEDCDLLRKVDAKITLTIGGERLAPMPYLEKLTLCNQVINGLDVMESILIRVNECVKSGQTKE